MKKCEIKAFFHCRKCIEELPRGIKVSPRDYSRLSVGLRADDTIQVWCDRHDVEVFHSEFVVPLVN